MLLHLDIWHGEESLDGLATAEWITVSIIIGNDHPLSYRIGTYFRTIADYRKCCDNPRCGRFSGDT